MKNIGLRLAALAVVLLLLAVCSASAQSVYNVTLSPVGSSGVSGTATTIAGCIGGANPYANVEVNINMNSMPPANSIYQAWISDTSQSARRSLGVFQGSTFNSRFRLPSFTTVSGPYNTILVSLEPANNTNAAPTNIVAQGNLPGSAVAASNFPSSAVLPSDESLQQQLVMQRYGVSAQDVASLRMMGWGYSDIARIANASAQCPGNSPINIANMLAQGQTWDQIASVCNTTASALFTPAGTTTAVAGSVQQFGTYQSVVPPLMYYRTYGNGAPIVTRQVWEYWHMRGYSWEDVAVAANIASMTGEDIGTLLRNTRLQGWTWRQIALDRGINIDVALDVSQWPFSRNGEPSQTSTPQVPNTTGGSAY